MKSLTAQQRLLVAAIISIAAHAFALLVISLGGGTNFQKAALTPPGTNLSVRLSPLHSTHSGLISAASEGDAVNQAFMPPMQGLDLMDEKGIFTSSDQNVFGDLALLPDLVAPLRPHYFRANELDHRAENLAEVELPNIQLFAGRPAPRLIISLLIDETGAVDDVITLESNLLAATQDHIAQAFQNTRFKPAFKDGHPVKSQKLIEVFPGEPIDNPVLISSSLLSGNRAQSN